ncbi:hypothetical protein [Geodermatophilus poikilotrophus]|uniref:Uncharacterized protein n=1 Tax=Geodermatophilus poikilotrophus TaxID=1333667 RepID=A0A1I0D3K3_9ACTN|nr:hypothetical protein [Geodermatophilus poikilotrophus]SET26791.1 hypothetical protein SAMN04488546_1912 [Geodermatophilus poikilotrophus]
MTAAPRSTEPIVLLDVDDLAEADLDADLAERLELDGRVFPRPDAAGAPADEVRRLIAGAGPRPTPADTVSLAEAIRRGGAAAVSVHELGLKAAMLAG